MEYEKRTKVRSAATGGMITFGVLATGFLTAVLGPLGFMAGVVLTGAGLKDTRDSAKSKMNELLTKETEEKLISTYKNRDSFKTTMTYKNSANNPFLSRMLFGNDITIENDYTKKI